MNRKIYRKQLGRLSLLLVKNTNGGKNLYNALTNKINSFSNNCNSIIGYRQVSPSIVDNSGLLIYPNPATTQLNINCKNLKEVSIYDYTGRLLINKIFDGVNSALINISKLSKGLFIVKAIPTKGEIKSSKLIIE